MAREESSDSRYESRYGGGFVTPAQMIAEIICARIANKNGHSLGLKFWNTDAWKKTFMSTLLAANSLLKLYSPRAIFGALRKNPKVYSLRASWFNNVVMQEQEHLDQRAEALAKVEAKPAPVVSDKVEKPRVGFNTKSNTLDKLRKLDG